jgi:hypothetical protein
MRGRAVEGHHSAASGSGRVLAVRAADCKFRCAGVSGASLASSAAYSFGGLVASLIALLNSLPVEEVRRVAVAVDEARTAAGFAPPAEAQKRP